MAESPAHKFGQVIGGLIESVVKPPLEEYCDKQGLYNARLGRTIQRILVIPLYGRINKFTSVEEALHFLDRHAIYEGSGEFRKYEILVEFSNGSKIDAFFTSKSEVRDFLSFVTTR
jgi:hypothetical protein